MKTCVAAFLLGLAMSSTLTATAGEGEAVQEVAPDGGSVGVSEDHGSWHYDSRQREWTYGNMHFRLPPRRPAYATSSSNGRQLVWTQQCDKYGNCRGVWKEKDEVWREQGGITIFQSR